MNAPEDGETFHDDDGDSAVAVKSPWDELSVAVAASRETVFPIATVALRVLASVSLADATACGVQPGTSGVFTAQSGNRTSPKREPNCPPKASLNPS